MNADPERADVLEHAVRPATDEPAGMLVLHHGRGTDERDLIGLADALDPNGRLHVVAPRAPLRLPGSPGFHWYVVRSVGYPDPDTFHASRTRLSEFHDWVWATTGVPPARTVLGGFSMGAVMSYATGLGGERPRPAGILALSGFVPTVEGWQPDLPSRVALPVLISHGSQDPVIDVSFARRARDLLAAAGLDVDYFETRAGHYIEPAVAERAAKWIARVVPEQP